MCKILLLEDDISLIDGLVYSLERNGFSLDVVRTVKDAMDRSAQKLEPFFRQLQEDTVKEKEAGKSGKKTEEKSSGSKAKKVPEEEEFLDDGVDFDEELENEIHRLLKDEEESEDGGQG